MAANQLRAPTAYLGFPGWGFSNAATLALSASGTWLALQFLAEQAKTLDNFRLYLSAKNGTLIASDLTLDLYSDVNGIPSASLEGPKSAASVPAAGNWVSWTGFTTALSIGPYWAVFKNANGAPATNFPTYQYVGGVGGGLPPMPFGQAALAGASPFYGWNKVHTLNSGTAWASGIVTGIGGLRVGYADGTYDGLPIQGETRPSSGGTSDRAFGKQEVGVRFNVPAGATWNVRGCYFPLIKTSTPGGLRFRIYQGATLLATSANTIPAANVVASTGDLYYGWFSSPVVLSSLNNPYRIVFGDATSGDANTVGYNSQLYTWDSDSNSLLLKPMGGSLQKTITADNTASPVVWTDTNTDVLPFLLALDTAGELTGAAGGARLVGPSALVSVN